MPSVSRSAPDSACFSQSVVLATPHPLEDHTDSAAGIWLVGPRATGLSLSRGPRDEHIEVELAENLKALDVRRAIALPEHRGDPLTVAQVDRIAGEQEAMAPAGPEKGGGPAGVAGGRDHLKVVVEHVTAGKGLMNGHALGDRRAVLLVAIEGSVHPVRGDHGFVPMVKVPACDAAEIPDSRRVGRERADAVDEQVALIAAQEEGADLERGIERK